MNYIIFDNIHDNNGFIAEALRLNGVGIDEIYSPASKYKWVTWIKGAFKAIQKSSSDDVLIFWYDFQAIICFNICRLLFLRRKLVILNILLKNKPTFKNRLASYLYKWALQSNSVKATISSLEYGKMLNRQLKTEVSYTLLHDVYPFCKEEEREYKNYEKKVFCGGYNGRDWDLAIAIAREMQEVQFIFVMPSSIKKHYLRIPLPKNICIFSDILLAEFNRLLQESSIVMLPLNTDAPAGLMVIFRAASQQKLVITTSTPVTKEYIDDQSGVLCKNNARQYIEEIRFHLQHADIAELKGKALQDKLKSKCSKEIYTKRLYTLLDEFSHVNKTIN